MLFQIVICFSLCLSVHLINPHNVGDLDCSHDKFVDYKAKFNKEYRDQHEHSHRFTIFQENCNVLNNIRQKAINHTANFGFTRFMDWSQEERINSLIWNHNASNAHQVDLQNVTFFNHTRGKRQSQRSIDYRNLNGINYISPVKDQGKCGSCWAFATTALTEFKVYYNHGNRLSSFPNLSEQQLVNCATGSVTAQEPYYNPAQNWNIRYTSYGCNGGNFYTAFNYIKNVGQVPQSAFPYTGQSGACTTQSPVAAHVSNYYITGGSEYDLANAVASKGPLGYMIWMPWQNSQSSLWYYHSGVYQPLPGECPGRTWTPNNAPSWPAHAVAVVGYNTAANPPYWIIKNSWGPNWGENGYVRWHFGNYQCAMYNWMWMADY